MNIADKVLKKAAENKKKWTPACRCEIKNSKTKCKGGILNVTLHHWQPGNPCTKPGDPIKICEHHASTIRLNESCIIYNIDTKENISTDWALGVIKKLKRKQKNENNACILF